MPARAKCFAHRRGAPQRILRTPLRRIFMLKKFVAFVFVMLLAMPALAEELNTKYFTVSVPEGWKVIMAPTEKQGTTSAIFANSAGDASVTFVIGPNSGADTKTIADMFSKQFKATKPPVEKGGQYTFTFAQQDITSQAWVASQGDVFMITVMAGDRKSAAAFVKKHVKSADYPALLPK